MPWDGDTFNKRHLGGKADAKTASAAAEAATNALESCMKTGNDRGYCEGYAVRIGKHVAQKGSDNVDNHDEGMLGQHKVMDNEDGSKTILEVPIFRLGTFKSKDGKAYDESWAQSAIKTHEALKAEDGYCPPVHIGHTKDGEEKPAVGVFDNLKLKAQNVVADLVRVPAEMYEQLRKGMWPSRSIEALNTGNTARIISLALLGSSPPACKFRPLHFDGNIADIESFTFEADGVVDVSPAMESEPIQTKNVVTFVELNTKEGKMPDPVKIDVVPEATKVEKASEPVVEPKKETGLDLMAQAQAKQFADVLAANEALKAELARVKAHVDKAEEDARNAKVDQFISAQISAGKVTPAILAAGLREVFVEVSDATREKLSKVIEALPKVASFSDQAVVGSAEAKVAESVEITVEQKAEKLSELSKAYASEHKVKIGVATKAVLKEHPELMNFGEM